MTTSITLIVLITAIIACATKGIELVRELQRGQHKSRTSDRAVNPNQLAPTSPVETCKPRKSPGRSIRDRMEVWMEIVLSVMSTLAFLWLLVLAATLPATSPHRITAMIGCMVVVACGLRSARY